MLDVKMTKRLLIMLAIVLIVRQLLNHAPRSAWATEHRKDH